MLVFCTRWMTVVLVLWFAAGVNVRRAQSAEAEKNIRLAFFCTQRTMADAGPFWGRFIEMMEHASDDLGIVLDLYFAGDNHLLMKKQLRDALYSDSVKPDGVIMLNFKEMGIYFLQVAEDAKVPLVLVNTGFSNRSVAGEPQERFDYWIAEILPDDEQAGRLLIENLLQHAPRRAPDGKIHVLALEGQPFHASSQARVKGLQSITDARDDVILQQVVNCEWSEYLAEEKVVYLASNRYTDISVVWAASDEIGLGAVTGLAGLGWSCGEEYVVGGIDWSLAGRTAVKDGRFSATVGGHLLEGAWAVIMLYDYLNGVVFRADERVARSPMLLLTPENADEISEYVLNDGCWKKGSFERFSKYRNPEQERYLFHGNYVEHLKLADQDDEERASSAELKKGTNW